MSTGQSLHILLVKEYNDMDETGFYMTHVWWDDDDVKHIVANEMVER